LIRVFICYSSRDASFADRLTRDLVSIGIDIFYAKWNIRVGESIVEKINEALISHDHLIIILSSNSLQSDWVKRELNSSLMRHLQRKEISIKPVLIENCEIPPLLADMKYADFREDYNAGFNELINSFQEDFALEPFLHVVENVGKRENLTYDHRFLAVILKRHSSFSTIGVRILSFLSEKNVVSRLAILSEVGEAELVQQQIDYLLENGLVDSKCKDEIKISTLGQEFLHIFSEGVSQGIVSPVCPY